MKNWTLTFLTFAILGTVAPHSVRAVSPSSPESKAQASSKKKPERQMRSTGKDKNFTATLTTYWAKGGGSDYWTKKMVGSTGERLKNGVTVAADPRVLPYGSVIEIAGLGRRVVQDTGSHVVQRVASHKRGVNYPVIDIFFEDKTDALRFANRSEPFAQIRVIKLGERT